MADTIEGTIIMDCPLCRNIHEVPLMRRKYISLENGEVMDGVVYFCPVKKLKFETKQQKEQVRKLRCIPKDLENVILRCKRKSE